MIILARYNPLGELRTETIDDIEQRPRDRDARLLYFDPQSILDIVNNNRKMGNNGVIVAFGTEAGQRKIIDDFMGVPKQ